MCSRKALFSSGELRLEGKRSQEGHLSPWSPGRPFSQDILQQRAAHRHYLLYYEKYLIHSLTSVLMGGVDLAVIGH